ncbi:PAS domain-containing protein [Nannocystis sp. RBIL2]|uniref:PAS domain-containing protein n=1 Tax=Nannocystis sp. RBIL2 TaxID=2996788 RepID=UPI002270213C|nr:PAS domain-containing protein [Nannocystis sp. RBIL2]MCY1067197.1 PAS domain-containing protein [Nannocystis sp. RBIL2]
MSLTLRGPAGDIRVDDGDGGEPRLARTHSDAWGIATLEHEWSLRDDLDASLALRPLTLVREGEAVTLTVADPGGRSLADLLGAPWEVAASLRVAIGLATALVRLHARGLAHNDVRAGNVWTNAATGECWLTGFGAAARLGAVVSDRSIDVRCDLRGCGSLLHELLVGSPSQTAERDHERTTALERIVARLSERDGAGYATAGQLLADLRRCAAARQRHGRIEPSRLDVDDAPDAFARPGADELLAIIDAVPGLVWRARAEGAIDFSSRGWRGYAGKGDAELHGWAWAMSDLIHPLDRAALVEAWARLLASGEEGRLEARLRRFDGHYRWFQIHAVPLLDARGEVATWWGLGSDIEEEKQARAGAAGEQRLLAMIVRGEPTSAILEGVVRLVESSASGLRASILLLDPETATMRHAAAVSLPRSYVERIDGTPIGPAAFACGTAAWRREPVFVTDIATDPLGALFREHALAHGLRACWSIPLLATDGRVLGAFGIYAGEPRGPGPFELELLERCARVTSIAIERSQSDEALKRSEAYRIEAERLSRTGSFGFDLRSREFNFSEGISELVGLPRSPRPTFAQVAARVHPDDRERIADLVRRTLRSGGDFDYEHRLVMDDGAVKLMRVVGRSRINADGNFELVGAATDITASRRAGDELQQAQAALAHVARVTTLGELAASIAHEVNQPLAAITADAGAALNWLAAAKPSPERARESLTAIIDHGERASQVLQRIRSLLSRSTPSHHACNLNDVVRDVVPLVAPQLTLHGVVIQQALLRDLPPVMGDPVQLQQVVLNLLVNAGDASKDVPRERRRVVIHSFVERRESGSFVHVAVEDAGVGLGGGADRARLFDAFYTTKENGLGMGLSISRSIIERHGGKLWGSANETHGATFQFAIEAAQV